MKTFFVLIVATLAFALEGPPVYAGEVVTIGGTGSALGTMKILGDAFEKTHPGLKVNILPSLGSSGAMDALSKKAIDIAVVSRELKPSEEKGDFSVIAYARTPFVFIANKDVRVSGITTEDVVRIYRGEKKNWPDGKRIRIRLRPAWDTETLILKSISPELSRAVDIALADHEAAIGLTCRDNADNVEKTRGAFGYCSMAQIISEKRHLKVLSYNGMTPSPKSLLNKTYSPSVPMIVVTHRNASAAIRKFTHFLQSARGMKLMEETGHLVTN
jgi:phosphate transport system substrate-binding protein